MESETTTVPSESIALPPNRVITIQELQDFPGLELQYVPTIFAPREMDSTTFWPIFSRLTYTSVVWSSAEEKKKQQQQQPYYAWFADKGDWSFSFGSSQDNAFIPSAWPRALDGLRYHVIHNVPLHKQVNRYSVTNLDWNGCLVIYLPPRTSQIITPSYRDGWEGRGKLIHEDWVVVGPEGTSVLFSPVPSSPIDAKKYKPRTISMLNGACVTMRGYESLRQWTYTFKNMSLLHGCCLIWLRALNPELAGNHKQWDQFRTMAAINEEKLIIPSMIPGYSSTTKTATSTTRSLPKLAGSPPPSPPPTTKPLVKKAKTKK